MWIKKTVFGLVAFMLVLPCSATAASFLENEAGISAHAKLAPLSAQNLADAAGAYKVIERQTAEYVVGSVALPDYNETHDVHVYLDISGDIIAYYRNTEVVSKMLDMRHIVTGQPVGSKLEIALGIVCQAMSVNLTEVKTYDFRYPEAQDIKIFIDERNGKGTDTFRLLIPGNFTVYKTYYSLAVQGGSYCGGTATIGIDGTTIGSIGVGYWHIVNGTVGDDIILPDVYHEVSIYNPDGDCRTIYGAIVILYTEN